MDNPVANPAPSKVLARTGECMRRLMEAGLSFDDLQGAIDDPKFRRRLVMFWQRRGASIEETEAQQAARKVMGKNFLGLSGVVEHFGIVPTDEQIVALGEIPFNEATLKACAETHILVADVGLSLLNVRSKVRGGLFYTQDWYDNEKFATRTEKACWRLIRKTPVKDSTSKMWSDQKALLGDEDEVPTARAITYVTMLYYMARNERLFEDVYIRTSDVDSGGHRVRVGHFDEDGFRVYRWFDSGRNGDLGVSSARKS
jgi:hypothetical protein